MWLASRIGSTPLISWVSGPITPLTFLVSIWLVAVTPSATSQLVSPVTSCHLAAEDAAGRVDLALGHLGALEHGLAEAGQPAGEAGKDAVGDRAADEPPPPPPEPELGGRAGGQQR